MGSIDTVGVVTTLSDHGLARPWISASPGTWSVVRPA
jgi:hypothetical protein